MTGLSLQQATTIVESALRKARATNCAPLAVAVLDAGGHLKAFAREDGDGQWRAAGLAHLLERGFDDRGGFSQAELGHVAILRLEIGGAAL